MYADEDMEKIFSPPRTARRGRFVAGLLIGFGAGAIIGANEALIALYARAAWANLLVFWTS